MTKARALALAVCLALTPRRAELRALWPDKDGVDNHGRDSGSSGTSKPTGLAMGSAEWFASLTKVGKAKGSNPGGVFEDTAGTKWYVKHYNDRSQGAGEHVANALYRAVGLGAPESVLGPNGEYASKWMDGVQGTLGHQGVNKDRADKVLDGFAADVLVANWDAVGMGHDNVVIHNDGQVSRVDQGGVLLHRAQGALKPEAGLRKIGEWDSLVKNNHYYAQVFHKAGYSGGDALGHRAIAQIDKITAARPKDGWKGFVQRAASNAPKDWAAKVGSILEDRHAGLMLKRAELVDKSSPKALTETTAYAAFYALGGSGSGNFAHVGRPGEVGGSGKDTNGTKQKSAPATQAQIDKCWEMKQAGHSYAKIKAATGLNEKQAATIVFKINKKQKEQTGAIKAKAEELDKFGGDSEDAAASVKAEAMASGDAEAATAAKSIEVNSPGEHVAKALETSLIEQGGLAWQPVLTAKDGTQYFKWVLPKSGGVNYGSNDVHYGPNDAGKAALDLMLEVENGTSYLPENTQTYMELAWDKAVEGGWKKAEAAPAPAKSIKDLAVEHGYQWQPKTWGPNTGTYAWFKNGVQMSAFQQSNTDEAKEKAAATINYGKGPMATEASAKAAAPAVKPAYVSEYDKAKGLELISKGTGTESIAWPIDDSVTRQLGSHYSKQVEDIGKLWAKKLDATELDYVKSYTGSAYGSINSALRSGSSPTSGSAKHITSALAKAPAPPPPELVWRGVNHNGFQQFISGLGKGDVIRMDGFQSTSIKPEFAKQWGGGHKTILEIKPAKGAYVRPVSSHKSEYEFILPHGANYRVRGMTQVFMSDVKVNVVQLEMLN